MKKKRSLLMPALLMIFSLVAIVSVSLSLTGSSGSDEGTESTEAPKSEEAEPSTEVAHTPPSLDDVPDDPLGEAILRGYDLTNDTSEVLRS